MNKRIIQNWIQNNMPNGQTKLAGLAGISPQTIMKILKNNHTPGLDIAVKLAKVLECTLDELAAGEEGSNEKSDPAA